MEVRKKYTMCNTKGSNQTVLTERKRTKCFLRGEEGSCWLLGGGLSSFLFPCCSCIDLCFQQTQTSKLCTSNFRPTSDPSPNIFPAECQLACFAPWPLEDKPPDPHQQFEQWPNQSNHHSLRIGCSQFMMRSKT